MKKILALTLAAVMTAGMTTVAFAATKDSVVIGVTGAGANMGENDYLYVLNDGVADNYDSALLLEGGDQVAIPLVLWQDDESNAGMQADELDWYTIDSDYDKTVNVYADWKVGEADAEVKLVKFTSETGLPAGRYYSVVVTIPENDSNKIADLSGTIQVGRTKSAAKNSDYKYSLGVSYAPDGTDKYVKYDFDGSDTLEAGKTGIVDFDTEAGEIDIEFGEQALFTVDVTGQSKRNLAWNTKFDEEFADKYNYANIDFIKFEGTPSFNKTGTLYIYADEDSFIYGVTDEGAKDVKAKWNDDYEAWEIRTRTLGAYAISDVELDEQTVTEDKTDESSKTDDGVKENPDTGR